MINTELHNQLIEKEMQKKGIEYDRINQIAKRAVLIERLKSYLLIACLIFIILLMLEALLWLFPSKSFGAIHTPCNKERIIKKDSNKSTKHKNNTKFLSTTKTKDNNTLNTSKHTLKNGTEYIKHDNFVYERVWKDGELIKEIKLERTIKDSRAKTKQIPQLATPLTTK